MHKNGSGYLKEVAQKCINSSGTYSEVIIKSPKQNFNMEMKTFSSLLQKEPYIAFA